MEGGGVVGAVVGGGGGCNGYLRGVHSVGVACKSKTRSDEYFDPDLCVTATTANVRLRPLRSESVNSAAEGRFWLTFLNYDVEDMTNTRSEVLCIGSKISPAAHLCSVDLVSAGMFRRSVSEGCKRKNPSRMKQLPDAANIGPFASIGPYRFFRSVQTSTRRQGQRGVKEGLVVSHSLCI